MKFPFNYGIFNSMELSELRQKIDEIDKNIVELFEARMEISEQVAEYKIGRGMKVLDKDREAVKIEAVKALTHSDFNAEAIEELYEKILYLSRKRQTEIMEDRGIKC